ncbi:hypothetical protein A9Q87_08020 [Flavobacteriales bacterium 34_180_T64]|nr:hypothetical protein A9Q87_08020 [Flavobacteriales bacterium 34_180_T64]
MKRIDDKIKEIEKRDKANRILYIGFVVLISIFMIFAFRTSKKIKSQGNTIDEQGQTIQAQLATEKILSQQLKDSIALLNKSLKPKQYWAQIENDKSVESYIDYITNEWGIDKPQENMIKAFETLHSDDLNVEQVGWLYIGSINNAGEFRDSKNRTTIVLPKNQGIRAPNKNDILKLTYRSEMNTYTKASHKNRFRTGKGWRPGTKAVVVDSYKDPGSTDYFIKIKYY